MANKMAKDILAVMDNANVRKFLDMLSSVEGTTKHGYNTTFGGGRAESLAAHPNIRREFTQTDGKKNTSTAAGRYQFMPSTWDQLKKGFGEQMPDFGEKSQDFGALALLAGRGALNDVVGGNFESAVKKVGSIWAGLPTSPYPQPKKSWEDVNKLLGVGGGSGGGGGAGQAGLSEKVRKQLYTAYRSGGMDAQQKAEYEQDFEQVKPAGAKALAVPQAAPKQPAFELPLEVLMAYNSNQMTPQQRRDLEADFKAGIVTAPAHLNFKIGTTEKPIEERDYTGNRMQQFLDRSGEALGNAGRAMMGDGIVDAATAIPRAVIGGAEALIAGAGAGVSTAAAGLGGLATGAGALMQGKGLDASVEQAGRTIADTQAAMQPYLPQPFIAPNTGNGILQGLSVLPLATEGAGQANYDAYGNPVSAALTQGLGDAAMAALGFRAVGRPPMARPATPTPQPTPRPQPTPDTPTPTPRLDITPASDRIILDAENPRTVIPAPDAQPAGRAEPTPAEVTTVGAEGLNVLHGSTRADLTADQVQVFNPTATQNRKGRKNGGFYTTPDAAVADKYANMPRRDGAPITPTVYDVQIKAGSRVLQKEGDITRLDEAYINEQRAAGVDVIAGKDPRGQVEYAVINPAAVGNLTPRAKPATPKTKQGQAFTTSNKPIDFEYDVVPIESVVKSTNADLTQNANARAELQPRNRDTDASTAQIDEIEARGNPNQETLFQRRKAPLDYIRDDNGEPLTLYHYSPKKIESFDAESGRFGGLFALDNPKDAATYGSFRYEMNVKGGLLDNESLMAAMESSEAKTRKSIKTHLKGPASKRMTADDYADVQWLVEDEYRAFDDPPNGEKSRLMQLLGAIDDGDLYAEAQLLRGKVAKDFGASAVRMNDEFGESSVLVVDGKNIEFIGDNAPKKSETLFQKNRSQADAIADRITAQAKAAGRSADEATQAGKLAAAYYAATAKAMGLTPDQVFARVGLRVERGDVGDANAMLQLGEREHAMVFGENANASSFIHESGHHFLETHAKLASESPALKADIDTVMTWAGHEGRAWSDLTASQKRELHEKFAESFERYLLTGKAPTKGLKGVFADFKQWLTDVYTSLAEFAATNPRADLSPEVMAVMDRMLGGGKAEKAANQARGKKRKSEPVDDQLLDLKRSAPVAGGVSPDLHQHRYNVLRDIGLTDSQIRGGSVEGDIKRLEWDTELSKYDTEYGIKMKQQLELEQQKLREYGDGVVESMGGTAGATPEVRGATIVRPLEAYQAWYKDKIRQFYKQADERGGMTGGIELNEFAAKLKENSAFSNQALISARKSIRAFMSEQRLLDTKGNIKPMSAKQAEMVRKHINNIRTFETGRVLSELNALIDESVFSTLGQSVYGDARAVNTQYHSIFSDAKGLAKLLNIDGINRSISHEKVGTNIAALAETDAAQFRHIMRQLEDMPTNELQNMADQAIGEIRSQIAEKITSYDPTKPDTVAAIGKALAPYRGTKLREIFGEKGAQKLETFVAAHGILRKVDANPSGSASMLRNVATKGAEVGSTGLGTAAGAALAGPAGAAAGAVIGQQIGAKIKGAIAQAVDKKSYGKAMSPRQLETMRQTYAATGRRLAALPETEAAAAAARDAPNSTRARTLNARLERTKEWMQFYERLTDDQKAAIKKTGAAVWLLSVGGLGDNQASDDGENR